MKTNNVFEQTASQIKSTTEVLKAAGFAIFDIPPERIILDKAQQLTWKNHHGGRLVSSKAFLSIDQYMEIVSTGAYQILLSDYSIVRYSFVFDGPKLQTENLLWWPCPVKMNNEIEQEFGLVDGLKEIINAAQNQSDYIMRSPFRMDFDSSNDKPAHPMAHVHFEHHDCRINAKEPMCFNRFMKFILSNFYPGSGINCDDWNLLHYQYPHSHRPIEYENKAFINI